MSSSYSLLSFKKCVQGAFVAFSLCVCSNALMAAEGEESKKASSSNKFVIGIYGGGSVLQQSSEYYQDIVINGATIKRELEGDYEQTLFGASYGAKIGYDVYILPRHALRIYADYMNTLMNSKEPIIGKYTMHTIGLNLDYKFEIIGGLGVFAGAGIAHNIIQVQRLTNYQAFGGSINAGLTYNISFIELELRLRYLAYDTRERLSTYLPVIGGTQTTMHKVDLDSPFSFHLGVNFRF